MEDFLQFLESKNDDQEMEEEQFHFHLNEAQKNVMASTNDKKKCKDLMHYFSQVEQAKNRSHFLFLKSAEFKIQWKKTKARHQLFVSIYI